MYTKGLLVVALASTAFAAPMPEPEPAPQTVPSVPSTDAVAGLLPAVLGLLGLSGSSVNTLPVSEIQKRQDLIPSVVGLLGLSGDSSAPEGVVPSVAGLTGLQRRQLLNGKLRSRSNIKRSLTRVSSSRFVARCSRPSNDTWLGCFGAQCWRYFGHRWHGR
jgi:hypothetical protein